MNDFNFDFDFSAPVTEEIPPEEKHVKVHNVSSRVKLRVKKRLRTL